MDPVVKKVFDRRSVQSYKNRANYKIRDSLIEQISELLLDKVLDTSIKFKSILHLGYASPTILKDQFASFQKIILADSSVNLLKQNIANIDSRLSKVQLDEEFICFKSKVFDLIISNLSLCSVNAIKSSLKQLHGSLKEDGWLVFSVFGVDSLQELRRSSVYAFDDSVSPRVHPFFSMKSIATLVKSAGFKEVIVDRTLYKLQYEDPVELFYYLKSMGWANGLENRRKSLTGKGELQRIIEYYQNNYTKNGKIYATFEVLTVTGWK